MPIVVQKYGGSSVADVTRIQKVAERIMRTKAAGYDVAVVVSAMGDTTDELLALARKVSPNPDRRELDMLLSAGERISMALLSMAIRELGGDAISFTGSQSGIITNDRHVDARIVEVRPYRVQDELARGRVVVIAGYQGVSYRREVTTLGRGGSDTTAVAMAAALGAEWCEICSDVDGVYTADPRVVPAAQRIGTLTYEETQELAEAGAKVLNAQAVEFAKEKGIAIYARATASALPGNDPASDGTVVRRHAPRMPGTVAGVASERDLLVLQATGDWTRVVSVLDECGVSGKQLHVATFGPSAGSGPAPSTSPGPAPSAGSGQAPSTGSGQAPSTGSGPGRAQSRAGHADGTTLVISRENLHNEDRLRRALTAGFGDDARLIDGLGAVSIVGTGINATYQNVRRGVTCLQDNGIQSFGLATSSFRATWLIERDQLDRAVRLLHALFIERASH